MKIIAKSSKKSFDFDIQGIIRDFKKKNEDAQVEFIKMKLNDLEEIDDLELNLLHRLKREYLLRWKYLGLILNGLLYQAEKFRQ
jgi:hypothetical protein